MEMLTGQTTSWRRPAQPIAPALAFVISLVLFIAGLGLLIYSVARVRVAATNRVEAPAVYFAPGGSPTAAVVSASNAARRSVHVQAYSFTSAPIAKALVAAEKRGVQVEAILDKSNETEKYSAADFLAHEGVPTFIDAKHAIAHNKVMIIDNETVLTGSFNFPKAAEEKNAENLLVLHDPALAPQYEQNWQSHLAHSQPYPAR